MGLEKYRKQINEIDRQILQLLNQRAALAQKIGEEKQRQNLPIYAPEREKQIYQRLLLENQGPLTGRSVEVIFKNIIEACRNLQNR